MTDHAPTTTTMYVDLPAPIEGEFHVFINGIPQQPGNDYRLEGRTLVFERELVPEKQMTRWQWALGIIGIAGSYQKHDTIDVAYVHQGRNQVAHALQPRPASAQE